MLPLLTICALTDLGWAKERLSRPSDPVVLFSLSETDPEAFSLKVFSAEEGRTLFLTSTLFDGRLVSKAKLAYRPLHLDPPEKLKDRAPRRLRFSLQGTGKRLGYGAEYQSIEKRIITPLGQTGMSNQEGGKIWGEGKFGLARVKTFLSAFWNKVDTDPARPQMTDIRGGVTTEVTPPSWPSFRFSYLRSVAKSSQEPEGFQALRRQAETLAASLSYSNLTWGASSSSQYVLLSDRLRPGQKTFVSHYTLSGFYRPADFLTLAPTVSVKEKRDLWSRVRTSIPSASLSLTYAGDTLNFTALGSCTKMRSRNGLIRSRTFQTTARLNWPFELSPFGESTLSLQLIYHRSRNSISSARSYAKLSGEISLQLASF